MIINVCIEHHLCMLNVNKCGILKNSVFVHFFTVKVQLFKGVGYTLVWDHYKFSIFLKASLGPLHALGKVGVNTTPINDRSQSIRS